MKPAAKPQSAVMIDQMMMQSPMMNTRLPRSAHMAIGMPIRA